MFILHEVEVTAKKKKNPEKILGIEIGDNELKGWYETTEILQSGKGSEVKVAQSCLTLWDPLDYTVHGILQARILEWVAVPFSRGSSQPRDWTQVFLIAGGFFTSWATREAQEYWSGQPIPSPADLLDPRIEPGSPALQADSSPTELSGGFVKWIPKQTQSSSAF